jgi:2-C-methyl-D-erythritol 2,4-cyclodiphosphate synthase
MLQAAKTRLDQLGWQVHNLDCIVFAEKPKLSPFKQAIRVNLAQLLQIPVDCVGLKAKTGERVGPVGREEAIMAQCVVLVDRSAGAQGEPTA